MYIIIKHFKDLGVVYLKYFILIVLANILVPQTKFLPASNSIDQ